MSASASAATITTTRVPLIAVSGRLDGVGSARMRSAMELACATGAGRLIVDLSHVRECDGQLFDLLSYAGHVMAENAGWLRLIGMSEAVLEALADAPLPDVLSVYRASTWSGTGRRSFFGAPQ